MLCEIGVPPGGIGILILIEHEVGSHAILVLRHCIEAVGGGVASHEWEGEHLQRSVIPMVELPGICDACRHRQDHPIGYGLVALQRVVDEETVNASVPVGHWMDVDEAKGDHAGSGERFSAARGSLEVLQAVEQ